MRVGIVGARGYVGGELLRILLAHPGVEVAWVTSSSSAGAPVEGTTLVHSAADPSILETDPVDAVFLALPNGESAKWTHSDAVVIDLSADHRFDDSFVYAQIERNRAGIVKSHRLACPGCYATAAQLAIAPLLELLHGSVHVFGISGYSGAGTAPSEKNDPKLLADNVIPYALTGHTHEAELTRQLGRPIFFMPHVASFFRGLVVTVSAELTHPLSAEAIHEVIEARYAGERFIDVQREPPRPRDVAKSHRVAIGGVSVRDRHVVVVAALDNLLGGAASQAVRAMNLSAGLPEEQGL